MSDDDTDRREFLAFAAWLLAIAVLTFLAVAAALKQSLAWAIAWAAKNITIKLPWPLKFRNPAEPEQPRRPFWRR